MERRMLRLDEVATTSDMVTERKLKCEKLAKDQTMEHGTSVLRPEVPKTSESTVYVGHPP